MTFKREINNQSKRKLGLGHVFAIASGAMISSGLFVLPGIAFAITGPSVFFAYFVASFLYLPALFATAELASAMPKSGGTYYFIERSLGTFAGTLVGLSNWVSISLKTAFALIGIGTVVAFFSPNLNPLTIKMVSITAAIVFALINTIGIHVAGGLQKGLVYILVACLVIYILWSFQYVHPYKFYPFMTGSWHDFFGVVGLVFVSFGGLTKVADISGEVKKPHKNLPRGMFLAFVIVNILYVLTVFVTVGVSKASVLSNSFMPISIGANATMGSFGFVLITLAAMFAYITTGNAGILSSSRTPFAMSKDGLLPRTFSKKTKQSSSPINSIWITTLFIVIAILFLPIQDLIRTASTMLLLSFVLLCIAVVIMRRAKIPSYRPSFRVPFQPWLSLAGMIVYILLIIDMGKIPLITSAFFFTISILWYLVYVRRHIRRESTANYLFKRLMRGYQGKSSFEDELVDLTLEKHNIELDVIDALINKADIIDLPETANIKSFCEIMSIAAANKIDCNSKELLNKMHYCKTFSEAIIERGIAVPHLEIEGSGIYQMIVLRSKDGISFPHESMSVHTAFVLIYSSDMKHLHLNVLAAISRIIHEKVFERQWLKAEDAEQLRNILLLSERKRAKHVHMPAKFK